MRNEGRDTICSGSVHKGTLLTYHAEERKLKSNLGRHDPTTKEVITQHPKKLSK